MASQRTQNNQGTSSSSRQTDIVRYGSNNGSASQDDHLARRNNSDSSALQRTAHKISTSLQPIIYEALTEIKRHINEPVCKERKLEDKVEKFLVSLGYEDNWLSSIDTG